MSEIRIRITVSRIQYWHGLAYYKRIITYVGGPNDEVIQMVKEAVEQEAGSK